MVRGPWIAVFSTFCPPSSSPRELQASQWRPGYPLAPIPRRKADHMRPPTSTVSVVFVVLCSTLLSYAKTITIVVGGNGTNQDPSLIFQPQEVKATVGDTVVFNFTNGTHTAIESTFAEPCIPAHDSNVTLNGFYSGLRDTANGTAQTTLTVQIQQADQNKTFWFFDLWGCGKGGVGAINANDSDWENFGAFVRNAKRLNGSGGSTSSSITYRPTSTRPVPTSTATSNSGERVGENTIWAISIFIPFLFTDTYLVAPSPAAHNPFGRTARWDRRGLVAHLNSCMDVRAGVSGCQVAITDDDEQMSINCPSHLSHTCASCEITGDSGAGTEIHLDTRASNMGEDGDCSKVRLSV